MNKIISILEHILMYCQDIEDTIKRFGKNKEIFEFCDNTISGEMGFYEMRKKDGDWTL